MTEPTFSYLSRSEDDTARLAAAVAEAAELPLVIALDGPLGAGKTAFVRGLAQAWGVPADEVQSPTFVLVREYRGRAPLYHLDAYRLKSEEEFWDLGPEELFDAPAVTCLEWAERVADCLPDQRLAIELEPRGPDERIIRCTAHGAAAERVVRHLVERLGPRPSDPENGPQGGRR